MPSKKSRNAQRQSANSVNNSSNSTPNAYPSPLFEFDSPSPAQPIEDLPVAGHIPDQRLDSDPELEVERGGERDLIDMHGTSGRVRGDRGSPISSAPLSPYAPAITFDLTEEPSYSREQVNDAGHIRSPVLARYVRPFVHFIISA